MTLRKRVFAFTLVELLVVIGIIAVLIGVLLPVLSKVQGRGRDLKCQSNIRQIVLALRGYAEENKGVFPYGFHWNRTNKPIPQSASSADVDDAAGDGNFVSWASQIGKWMKKGKMTSQYENENDNFPDALQCPEAQMVHPHPVSYVMNMIVGIRPDLEFRVGALPRAQVRPPSTTTMLKDTVLVWDTACFEDSENSVGYLSGGDIDNQRFWEGADIPQYRYYSLSDPFGRILPGTYGNNRPINLSVGSRTFYNKDPTPAEESYPYQGNLRFRHQGETACNAGFIDGHVEAFKAKMNSDRTVKTHDALRRYFMTKWPTGVGPDPSNPF